MKHAIASVLFIIPLAIALSCGGGGQRSTSAELSGTVDDGALPRAALSKDTYEVWALQGSSFIRQGTINAGAKGEDHAWHIDDLRNGENYTVAVCRRVGFHLVNVLSTQAKATTPVKAKARRAAGSGVQINIITTFVTKKAELERRSVAEVVVSLFGAAAAAQLDGAAGPLAQLTYENGAVKAAGATKSLVIQDMVAQAAVTQLTLASLAVGAVQGEETTAALANFDSFANRLASATTLATVVAEAKAVLPALISDATADLAAAGTSFQSLVAGADLTAATFLAAAAGAVNDSATGYRAAFDAMSVTSLTGDVLTAVLVGAGAAVDATAIKALFSDAATEAGLSAAAIQSDIRSTLDAIDDLAFFQGAVSGSGLDLSTVVSGAAVLAVSLAAITAEASAATTAVAEAPLWKVATINVPGVTNSQWQAVAYWGAKNKLYLVYSSPRMERRNLFVYDTDAEGNLTGSPRRYGLIAPGSRPDVLVARAMLVSERHRKLYVGLGLEPSAPGETGFTTDLSVFSLDENGEPDADIGTGYATNRTGTPAGTLTPYITCLALHPRLDVLYCGSEITDQLGVVQLDAQGTPAGFAVEPGTGGHGWGSLGISKTGAFLYASHTADAGNPAMPTFYAWTLDPASGRVVSTRSYRDERCLDFLPTATLTPKAIFYRNPQGHLAAWPVDPLTGALTGTPSHTDLELSIPPQAMSDGSLCLVETVTFQDALSDSGNQLPIGIQVNRYAVGDDASLTLLAQTDTTDDDFDRITPKAFSATPSPVVSSAYAEANRPQAIKNPDGTVTYISPYGNRFGKLGVRYTVNSFSYPEGDIGLLPRSLRLDTTQTLTAFTFACSAAAGRVYALSGNALRSYDLDTGTFPEADYPLLQPVSEIPPPLLAVDDATSAQTGRVVVADSPSGNAASVEILHFALDGSITSSGNLATGMVTIGAVGTHPDLHQVYLAGFGGTAGPLAANGTAASVHQLPVTGTVNGIAVSGRHRKVYLATSSVGTPLSLQVADLEADGSLSLLRDASGAVSGANIHAYAHGFPAIDGFNGNQGFLTSLCLHPTLNKLYVSGARVDDAMNTADAARFTPEIVVHDLDADGLPTGGANVIRGRTDVKGSGLTLKVAIQPDGSHLYFTRMPEPAVFHVALDARSGLPSGNVDAWGLGGFGDMGYGSVLLTQEGDRLLLGDVNRTLQILDLRAGLPAPTRTPNLSYSASPRAINLDLGALETGVPSREIRLDAALKDLSIKTAHLSAFTDPLLRGLYPQMRFAKDVSLTLDFLLDGRLVGSSTALTRDGSLSFFAPGYDCSASVAANLDDHLLTGAQLFAGYADYISRAVAAPARFLIADLYNYADGTASFDSLFTLAAKSGRNALKVGGSNPAMPKYPEEVHAAAAKVGIRKFVYKGYNPPGYFAFKKGWTTTGDTTDQGTWQSVTEYVDDQLAAVKSEMGAQPSELALLTLADEPSWYFPMETVYVDGNAIFGDPHLRYEWKQSKATHSGNTTFKSEFADYLKTTVNGNAHWFGLQDWSAGNVHLGRQLVTYFDAGGNTEARRLWYWTQKFFVHSQATLCANTTLEALARSGNPDLLTTVNLLPTYDRWCFPHPFAELNNNPENARGGSGESCTSTPEWFQFARENPSTCGWTEDWFEDNESQRVGIHMDLLRCSLRNSPRASSFGSYVTGQTVGKVEDGASYKVLGVVGKGGKAIEFYYFGLAAVQEDTYSDAPASVHQAMADAVDIITKKESVLYPGKPRNGTVAILVPVSSQIWDKSADDPTYFTETMGIHYALTHANIPVDYVDEVDVENGKLDEYGYKTLYVTAPNLSPAVQSKILSWVRAGGTCAMFPGAGRKDEYDDAFTTTLYDQQGCTYAYDGVPRLPSPRFDWVRGTKVLVEASDADAAAELGAEDVWAFGQTVPLSLAGGNALLHFSGNTLAAALVEKACGSGEFLTYGWWPGNYYFWSGDRFIASSMPTGYDAVTRAMLTAPAGASFGNAGKHVSVSVPLVQGEVLDSSAGFAVTLLNWSGRPVNGALTVRLPLATMPAAMRTAIDRKTLVADSCKTGSVTCSSDPDAVTITLPGLKTVDVISVTW